jgi:hypothetical protein
MFEYGVSAFVIGVPMLTGVIAVVAGAVRWRRVRRLAAIGTRVTAVVTENQHMSTGEGTRYLPVVRFRTIDGRDVKAVLGDASSHRSHLTGTPIEMVYDPGDPRRVARAGNRGGAALAAIVVGVVFIGFGMVAFLLVSTS